MSEWPTRLRLRLRAVLRRRTLERDLQDEIAFHLAMREEQQRQSGLSVDQARARARRRFGNATALRDRSRDVWIWPWLQDATQDARFAVRMVRRARGATLVAIVSLGLGIGATTVIFSLVNALLLRPLPVAAADRLVQISRGQEAALSIDHFGSLRSGTDALGAIAATLSMESDLVMAGDSEFISAELVSGNYAEVFGVGTSLGRWFTDDREPVAVISDAVWERRFARHPDVLGQVIQSGRDAYTIIGVAPRAFVGVRAPMRTDLWLPIETRFPLTTGAEDQAFARMMMFFGRLRPDASASEATAELRALAALTFDGGAPASAGASPPLVVDAVGALPNSANRRLARTLTTLMGAVVALVLMIACVNVGHLLLARGALRQNEFMARRALGASRARLLGQLLTEALVLAASGTLCGVIVALWAGNLLERSIPPAAGIFALQLDLSLDWRVLLFTASLCAMTTVLCGLLPAWRASATPAITVGHRGVGAGARRRPIGLVAQVVMSLVLAFVAANFVTTLVRLSSTSPGFEVSGRLYAHTLLPSPPFASDTRRNLYAAALDRLRAIPGVRQGALTSSLPLIPARSECVGTSPDVPGRVTTSAVNAAYFDAMGIARVAGRSFAAGDRTADEVVITESLARQLWPDRPAIGERLMIGCADPASAAVIGVVRDSAVQAVGEPAQPHLYRPFTEGDAGTLVTVLLDTATDPAQLSETVRHALLEVAPGIRVYAVQPLGVHVSRSFSQLRWLAGILAGLGALAMLLAAVGLYGTTAYRVSLRTREIGLRMALGATRPMIFREVVGHGLLIVAVGVAIGELLTVPLTNVVASVQEHVGPTPLWTHVAVALVWLAIGAGASYMPAARAARLDPSAALRVQHE